MSGVTALQVMHNSRASGRSSPLARSTTPPVDDVDLRLPLGCLP